jgi:hypothetical protein
MNDDYSSLITQQTYVYEGLKEVRETVNALDIVDLEDLFNSGTAYGDLEFDKRMLAAALLAHRSITVLRLMLLQRQNIHSKYDKLAATALNSVDDIENYLGGRTVVSLLEEIKMFQHLAAEFEANEATQ